MFTIKPAVPEDYYDIKGLFEAHGEELSLTPEKRIMVAREEGLSGIGLFEIKDGSSEFLNILMCDENNETMKYFIAKAVLNSIDLSGICDVYSSNEKILPTLLKCGFKQKEDKLHLNLKGYFTACTDCADK